jgi:lipopolysaccharide export system permease protein
MPYGILLATLLTLGNLSRHSELTAMKAGGVSLYRITLPLLIVALIFSFVSFLGNEYLVPYTNVKAKYLLDVRVKKEEPTGFLKNYKIWYWSENQIFNIQVLDSQLMVLKGLTLYQVDSDFRCTRRVDAREARCIDGKWRFYKGAVRSFGEDGSIQTVSFRELEFPLKESWESFQKIEQRSDDLSYTGLATYIRRIREAGYDSTRYLVDLYSKLSYPFLNLVMVLIGIPFGLKAPRSGGVALNVGISVLVAFIYGMFFYIFLSFGKSGILPPFVAAWTPTVLFFLGGIFTLMSVRQ